MRLMLVTNLQFQRIPTRVNSDKNVSTRKKNELSIKKKTMVTSVGTETPRASTKVIEIIMIAKTSEEEETREVVDRT